MIKLQELEKKLKKYQQKYQALLRADKAASSRHGNEETDMRMSVLGTMIAEIKTEILELKKKRD